MLSTFDLSTHGRKRQYYNEVSGGEVPACGTLTNGRYTVHVSIDIEVASSIFLWSSVLFQAEKSVSVRVFDTLLLLNNTAFVGPFAFDVSGGGLLSVSLDRSLVMNGSTFTLSKTPIISSPGCSLALNDARITITEYAAQQSVIFLSDSAFTAHNLTVTGTGADPRVASFLSATNTNVTIDESLFTDFLADYVIHSSLDPDEPKTTFSARNSRFEALGTTLNPFKSVLQLESQHSISLTNISISVIEATQGLVVQSASSVNISGSSFSNITSPTVCAALLLNDVLQSSLRDITIQHNSFGEWWTACFISALSQEVALDAKRLIFNGNINPSEVHLYEMTGWSFLIQGNVKATLQDLDFEGESKFFSSVGIIGASVLVLPNDQMSGIITWRGFVSLCGAIAFEQDADMLGRLLLSRANGTACPQLNTVDLRSHNLRLLDPFGSSHPDSSLVADHWLQTGHFMNGTIFINTPKTTICCDLLLDDALFSDSVNLTNIALHANTSLTWGASKTGFFLQGASSRLIIEDGGSIVQTRPESPGNPRTIISGEGAVQVKAGGRVFAASLDIEVSSFILDAGADLYLYPSNWSQIVQHATFKNATLDGTVNFMPDYLVADFTPNLFYNLGSESFSPYGGFQVLNTPLKAHNLVSTAGALNFSFTTASSPALPKQIHFTATLSSDMSSLVLNFPIAINPSDAVPCPELDFDAMQYAQSFPYTCIWHNATQVSLYLQEIKPTVPLVLKPSTTFIAAEIQIPSQLNPIFLDITYSLDSCGILQLTSGNSKFGSVKPTSLSWSVVCGLAAAAACSSSPSSEVTPSFTIDTLSLMPDVYTINLLASTGIADATFSIVVQRPPTVLQVSIDGPLNRTVLASSGLLLTSSFNLAPSCTNLPVMVYSWDVGVLDGGSFATNSPNLYIPPNQLPSPLDYQFYYPVRVDVSSAEDPGMVLASATVLVRFNVFPALLTSSNSRYVFNSASSEVALQVETQPRLDDSSNTRYVWTILECPGLNAGSRFRPVVGLNLTIPEAFKCQYADGTTFDGPYITNDPRLKFSSADLRDGSYTLQVVRTDLSSIESGLITTELSTRVAFLKTTDSAPMWVEIILPPLHSLRASQRLPARLQINDGTKLTTGINIAKLYEIQWVVLAPRPISLPTEQTNKTTLIVPFDYVLTGDVTLRVVLTPKLRTTPALTGSRSLSLGTGPTGGYVTVKSLGSYRYTLSTFGWTSHTGSDGSEGFTYKFYAKNVQTGVTLALSDVSVSSSLTVQLAPSSSFEFTAIASDALGRSGASVTLAFTTAADNRRSEGSLVRAALDALTSVEAAVNASNWNMLQTIVAQQLGTMSSSNIPIGNLLAASLQLAPVLPPTESSASSSLSQINTLLSFADSSNAALATQLDTVTQKTILDFVQSTLGSSGSRFGSASSTSLASSKSLLNILSTMLTQAPDSLLNATQNPNQQAILSLLSEHSLQVLSQLFPDEMIGIASDNSLKLLAGKVGLVSGQTVLLTPPSLQSPSGSPSTIPSTSPISSSNPTTSSPSTTTSPTSSPATSPNAVSTPAAPTASNPSQSPPEAPTVTVSLSSSPVEGYIGFSLSVFENGTYPIPSDVPLVTVLQFSTSGANGSDLDPTKTYETTPSNLTGNALPITSTTFSLLGLTPAGKKPACSTYDASKGKWVVAQGCKTTVSNGKVTCTCTNGGPQALSVLFQVDGGIAKSGGKGGLSTLGIVMLSIFMSVLFVILLVVLICLLVPGARKIARPYSRRTHGFS